MLKVTPASEDPQARQYRGKDRHHRWFIDLRYLVKLKTGWVYSICIIEGYSRKVLAGLVSPYQDLVAVLQVVHAAIATYGCPTAIVSDNGSVFRSHGYQAVLAALDITAEYMEKGRPWQNLIEAPFGIQRRMADASFQDAETLEPCQTVHATWIDEMNTTAHWAHRSRADGRKTPETVLDWVRGRIVDPEDLAHAFRQFQVTRTVNAHGFVSIQRFSVYAERGLARHRVSVWLYEGRLRVEYQQTLLAQYTAPYDRINQRISRVTHPQLIATEYPSPQLALFELDDDQWQKIYPRPYERRTRDSPSPSPQVEPLALFG
jgi:transposase InsO family protein